MKMTVKENTKIQGHQVTLTDNTKISGDHFRNEDDLDGKYEITSASREK